MEQLVLEDIPTNKLRLTTVALSDTDHESIRAHIYGGDVKLSIVNHVADTLLTMVLTKEQMEKLIDAYSSAQG